MMDLDTTGTSTSVSKSSSSKATGHGHSYRYQLLSNRSEFFSWKTMGLSENSVPLHPMVNDHYPY